MSTQEAETLATRACEMSLTVTNRIESRHPSVETSYYEFSQTALRGLEAYETAIRQLTETRDTMMKIASDSTSQYRFLEEQAIHFEADCANSDRRIRELKDEIDAANDGIRLLRSKLSRSSVVDVDSETTQQVLSDAKARLPVLSERVSAEKAKQKVFEERIANFKQRTGDTDATVRNRIKKNQMRATELEAKIKRTLSMKDVTSDTSGQVQSKPEPVVEKPAGPSMIIHRTHDAEADEVRMLRTAMEDAITKNASLKAQLIGIQQDLSAMHEENSALKEVMRSVMASAK